jgi:hypothetical protein
LLLGDRYYGVAAVLVDLPAQEERHFLVRVKKNLTRRFLKSYPDGSALVEIGSGADMLTPAQVSLVVRRSLKRIADMAIPKRRARTCPRKLRQPVSSWPRLRKNTCGKGAVDYSVGEIYA